MADILNDTALLVRIWLSFICTPGSGIGERLLDAFGGDVTAIYDASSEDYGCVPRLEAETIAALCDKSLAEADKCLSWCLANDVTLLAFDDPRYPRRLRRIRNRPILLYCRGTIPALDSCVCIGMVGTRSMTEYGRHSAYTLAYDLACGGAVVVSGLALGVDSVCHRGCIDAGGFTVAVTGCGIDRVYPPGNEALAEEIARRGLIVTEYRPGTPPVGSNFPVRNRIISGLSQGVTVVEAAAKSGALITARAAISQGRDIFALPGKVGEYTSSGTNSLIKDGARIVTDASDILAEYEALYPHKIDISRIPSRRSEKYTSPLRQRVAAPPPAGFGTERLAGNSSTAGKVAAGKKAPPAGRNSLINVPPPAEAPSPVEAISESLSGNERRVWELIDPLSGSTPDELTGSGLPISAVMSALTMLEVKGAVTAVPGGKYKRSAPRT